MALYSLIFKIDGTVVRTDSVEAGVRPPAPTVDPREGYDFSGWKNLPSVMPADNVVVEGSWVKDGYTLTAEVDGEVWKTAVYSSGDDLSDFPTPRKKGHTFGGWTKKYKRMPKSNLTLRGNFKVNTYTLSFEVDGMTFDTTVEYGAPLDFILEPERDNYIFNGWGKIPATMPDHDLHFHGSFRPNTYTLTFLLDGEVFATSQLAFGDPVEAPEVPSRAGASFGGWKKLPDTMPDCDVTVEGKYRRKKNKLVFEVDGKQYARLSLSVGAGIPLPEEPKKEGFRFRMWEGLPEAMPASDTTVTAVFDEEA